MAWLALGSLTRQLRDGETVVGSGADADWRVPTADLMPRHFVVSVNGSNTAVRASSPDIVVVVNGEQLSGAYQLLNDGDVISAGRGQFSYGEQAPRITEAAADDSEGAFLIDVRAKVAHPLTNRSTTIGRDAANAIGVRDPRASRFHAEIRREAGGFALHSMGSGGTSLNGEMMEGPRLLEEGDAVEIAFTRFHFTRKQPSSELRVAPASAEMNDVSTSMPTIVRPRVTLESTVAETRPPGSTMFVAALVVLVVLIAGIFWLRQGF
jgi:pSer/pThr/pTyr-binding forkhead associated (FHA) protein